MKLCTTTADLESYAKTPAEAVRLFKDTGFKCLDFNFYRMSRPGSLLLQDNWQEYIEEAAAAAEEIGVRFTQAHSPDGNPFAEGEEYDLHLPPGNRWTESGGPQGCSARRRRNSSRREMIILNCQVTKKRSKIKMRS